MCIFKYMLTIFRENISKRPPNNVPKSMFLRFQHWILLIASKGMDESYLTTCTKRSNFQINKDHEGTRDDFFSVSRNLAA